MEPEGEPTSPLWDTIAARATPPGVGAIGIIRISGRNSYGILDRIFRHRGGEALRAAFLPGRAYLGEIVDRRTRAALDEVLVLCSKGPRSYTGEDCVEIHCHGGPLVLRSVLDGVLAEGARLAEAGEFTRRALLNGRVDLAQAEAVLDLIEARSPTGLSGATARLLGELSAKVHAIQEDLREARACVEATLDFPDEGLDEEARDLLGGRLRAAREALGRLCASHRRGRIHGEGVRAALVGRPNVGKSSLFNRMLGRERVIVTDVPGTTRDTIEEPILLSGVPFRLVDTAGLGEGAEAGPVERLAADAARQAAQAAELRVVVVDSSAPLAEDDRRVLAWAGELPGVVALNKADLPRAVGEAEVRAMAPRMRVVRVSALTGEGIGDLEVALAGGVDSGMSESGQWEGVLVQSERHYQLLSAALGAVARAFEQAGLGMADRARDDGAIVALEIREATLRLGELLGEGAGEDLLDRIFRRFCVGK